MERRTLAAVLFAVLLLGAGLFASVRASRNASRALEVAGQQAHPAPDAVPPVTVQAAPPDVPRPPGGWADPTQGTPAPQVHIGNDELEAYQRRLKQRLSEMTPEEREQFQAHALEQQRRRLEELRGRHGKMMQKDGASGPAGPTPPAGPPVGGSR